MFTYLPALNGFLFDYFAQVPLEVTIHEVLWQQDILYIILMSSVNSYCKVEYVMTAANKLQQLPSSHLLNNPGGSKKGWEHLCAFRQQKNEHRLSLPWTHMVTDG